MAILEIYSLEEEPLHKGTGIGKYSCFKAKIYAIILYYIIYSLLTPKIFFLQFLKAILQLFSLI